MITNERMFMTLTAYAARRGCSPKAVSKAIASGRLSASVTHDQHGQPKIADADLADREWAANTRARADYAAPKKATRVEPSAEPAPTSTPAAETAAPDPAPRARAKPKAEPMTPASSSGAVSPELAEYYAHRSARESAAARTAAVHAELAELELAERRGQMIPVETARLDVMERYAIVKTKLLGVPRRVAQRVPQIAAEVILVMDEMLREALEELASDDHAA